MAEGDTIHRLARRMEAELGGKELTSVATPSPRSPLIRVALRLEGRTLEGAEARGKHLVVRFSDDLALRSHLRMSGAWHIYAAGERWRKSTNRAWLVLAADGVEAVQFDGPELELLRSSRLRGHPKLARLGPDLLADGFEPERGVSALRRAGQERELGEALLDQGLLAGIGNVFKSEGCFSARVSPWRRLGELEDGELRRVVASTAELMRNGLETGHREKRIYRRVRQPCPRCGMAIRSRGQGDDNRITYWCPGCQG